MKPLPGGAKSGHQGGEPPPGPDEEAPPLRFGVIWRLGRVYLGRFWLFAAGYLVISLLNQAVLQPTIATLFKDLTNAANYGKNLTNAANYGKGMAGTYVGWAALTLSFVGLGFCVRRLTASMDVSVGNAMRRDVFARILQQGPRFFHEHDEGELAMVVNQITVEAQSALRYLLVDPVIQVVSLFSIGGTLVYQIAEAGKKTPGGGTGLLFGLVAAAALISPWLVSRMGKRLQRSQLAMQRQNLGLASLVGSAIKAPEEIQAMRAEGIFDAKHRALLAEYRAARLRGAITIETLNLCNRLPGDVVLCALLGIAVSLSIRAPGALSSGTLVAVAILTPQFMSAVQNLGGYSISLSLGWPAIALIDSMLGPTPVALPEAGPRDVPPPGTLAATTPVQNTLPPAPVLEVAGLRFSYAPERLPPVLDLVDFAPPPGKITALIARAGAGKTTFFRLAMRFYDPLSGEIRLDGVRHADLPLSELRRRIVLMAQFPAFFADTVRENFLLAKPGASDEEIRRWAELTGIWDVLARCFPQANPLDAPFRSGAPLSGGQRKLFALTRCLLREPDFLFLDEPTTGMDPETKFHFIPPMRKSCVGRTVLVVDHDILWQIRFCDYFLVLNEGKIAEQGTARELLVRHGLFRDIFDEQTQGVSDILWLLAELDLTEAALAPARPPITNEPPLDYAIENR